MGGVAIAVFVLLLARCGTDATPTTSTTTSAPEPTTPESVDTTTVSTSEVGSQPLPGGYGLLEPGDYHTRLFQPTTEFDVESAHALLRSETESAVYLRNRPPGGQQDTDPRPYTAVSVHSVWRVLSPDEILEELYELERIEFGPVTDVEVGGYPAQALEGSTSLRFERLWSGREDDVYWFEPESHMRFIVVDTPAGSLMVIIAANSDVWDDFLPVAEEIIAGISFPDLE